MSDPQDVAEALDGDKFDIHDNPDVEPEFPKDELLGADEYGITAAEERWDEPLEERLERESPDPLAVELDREVLDEDRDRDETSLEAELDRVEDELDEESRDAARAAGGLPPDRGDDEDLDAPLEGAEVGRIVEPGTDEDASDFIDEEADAVGHAEPADDLSAEEQAMHLTDDPPMGRRGGGYV
jgi:hypothetical protein